MSRMSERTKQLIEDVKQTLQWVNDIESEMIEQEGYTKEYLSLNSRNGRTHISQNDLDFICKMVNAVLKYNKCKLRIDNHMGEIVPVEQTQASNCLRFDITCFNCAKCVRGTVGGLWCAGYEPIKL